MALAVLALAAIGPGSNEPAEATFPGTNGKIAFASVRNGDFDIYTMNADGSDQTQLTQNLGLLPASAVPAWSPDGQKIAFMSVDFADATFDIYLMNADGSGLTNLTSSFGPRAASPAFSPDGSKIAFAAVTGTTQIHVMNIDGTGITNISNSATYDNQPDWSPDGSKIAFHSYATPGNIEVFVMNADGTGQTNLSNNPTGIDMTPSWSPDGSRIALRRNTGTPEDITYDIFTINPDGTGATNLTNTPDVREFDPSWSPDGTKIAFQKKGTGEAFPDIYVMNADGSGIIRLTDDSLQDIEPAWQPIPIPGTITPTPTITDTPTITPTPTITDTPTITPTPTLSPPTATPFDSSFPAMLLSLPSHDTCNDPVQPTICTLATGTTFTVSVDLLNPPPLGYVLAQAWLDYDSQGLVHMKNTQATWPDCHPETFLTLNDLGSNGANAGCLTGLFESPASFYSGSIYTFELTCTNSPSTSNIQLIPSGTSPALTNGSLITEFNPKGGSGAKYPPKLGDLTIACLGLLDPGDTDGDGCSDRRELGDDETLGGRRDYQNPWDFYDVLGGGGGPPDGTVDLTNDIFGVIQHYAPTGAKPEYDVNFDRGPSTGPNAWNMTAPDGVIDLTNDIMGVIQQYLHDCR